jgi:hypothetical protein
MYKIAVLFLIFFTFEKTFAQNPTVYIAMDTECPMTQKYTVPLKKMIADFPKINFVAMFTKWETDSTILQFKADYQIVIKDKIDYEYDFFKKVNATVVPSVYFFDEKNNLLYSGSIDNWFYDLGKYRLKPTEFYLENAIKSYLKGECIDVEKTVALGCILEY